MEKLSEVAGAQYEAKVGILKDYDNIWDAEIDNWHRRVDSVSQKALYAAAQKTHTPLDYVYLTEEQGIEELQKYQVLFYPHATIMTKERAALLEQYVKEGGTLVIGCRSGYKDENGHCVMDRLPALLSEVTGTDIPEYSLISPDAGKVMVDWDGDRFEASVFTDLLAPEDKNAKVVGSYATGDDAGWPALICHPYGKGRAYYYGSAFTEEAAALFMEKLGVKEPYRELVTLPESCEIAVRKKGNDRYVFLLNYDRKPQKIILHRECRNLYTDELCVGEILLDRYETLVIKVTEEK